MKKFITITLILFFGIGVTTCTKEELATPQENRIASSHIPPPPPLPTVGTACTKGTTSIIGANRVVGEKTCTVCVNGTDTIVLLDCWDNFECVDTNPFPFIDNYKWKKTRECEPCPR